LVTFGAVVAWSLHVQAGLPLVVAALVTLVIAGLFGASLESGIFRPLRRRKLGPFQLVVLTIGLSLVIRQVIFIFFGGEGRFLEDFNIQ
jgi:neutral amino acid transport system permease protein